MAIDFDGSTQYAEASSAVLTAYPIAMAAWFNVDNTTASHTLCSIDTNAAVSRFMLQADGAGSDKVIAYVKTTGATTAQASSTGTFTAGTWFHGYGILYSATVRYSYIDGANGSLNSTNRTPSGVNRTNIGSRWDTSRGSFCNGRIAELGVWDDGLDDDEIAALAAGWCPRRIRRQSLRMYCPLVADFRELRASLAFTATGSPPAAAHPRRYG